MYAPRLVSYSATVCVLMLGVNVCRAQVDAPVQLTWEVPENCSQLPEVQLKLRELVGASGNELTTPLRAYGTIEPLGKRYRLTLVIERTATRGTRVIESDDCHSLGRAAAVVLGLLVQKERALGRELSESEISGQSPSEPEKQPTPVPPKEAQPTAIAEPQPLPPRTQPSSWHLLVRAPEASVNFMTLPRVGYGIGLGVGVAYQAWRATIAGALYPSQDEVATRAPFRVEFRRKAVEIAGCRGWRSGSVEVAPCVVVAADDVLAQASGDNLVSTNKTAFWISIGGGISGYLHLFSHLSLVASGSGLIATKRSRFLVGTPTGLQQAHKVPLGTASSSIACEWIF
jgi:hypothetical protein